MTILKIVSLLIILYLSVGFLGASFSTLRRYASNKPMPSAKAVYLGILFYTVTWGYLQYKVRKARKMREKIDNDLGSG